jgi:GNAT superfamily N-acetyltransferase
MIEIRRMRMKELGRIGEIDRSEHVKVGYDVQNGQLVAREVDWHVPPWNPRSQGEHSVQQKLTAIRDTLDAGGVAFGAFDGDRLVACATLRHRLRDGLAQLAGLWVSAGHRRRGIATGLLSEIAGIAHRSGAHELYVSAAPTESAVGSYRKKGFCLAPPERIDPQLYEKEPEDIHMILSPNKRSHCIRGTGGRPWSSWN